MESLGLLVGHLLGDFVFQNDWMAKYKTNPPRCPHADYHYKGDPGYQDRAHDERPGVAYPNETDGERTRRADLACTVHCLLYTFCVWACSFWWMPWCGLVVCFFAHWPVDRFRLAGWWMRNVSGQKAFADGPLAPWSVIIVDNTFHVFTLFVIGLCSGVGR